MNNDPDWNLHRTFLAVAREGSLSAAARRLGLTQPTAARHVEALEQAVGADLFLRSQRGLVPTELGLSLLPHAEALASAAAALMRTATGRVGEIAGSVRVSASEVMGIERLPTILARLRRDHPRLTVELVLSDDVQDLLQREADIAVRQTQPLQGALLARRLPSTILGLHAHRDYIERRGTPRSLADLARHDVTGFDRETPAMRAFVEAFPAFDRSLFAFRADSNLAQLAAIRAGLGIGVCQVGMARRSPDLVRVLAGEVALDLPLWIVMHEDLKTSARCRAVFDALVDGLDGEADR